jgi:hypothetical protein
VSNLSLFDIQMQKGAGETGRPVDAGDAHQPVRASSDHAVDAERASSRSAADGVRRAPGSEIPLKIVRIITAKGGAFRELGRDDEGTVCPTGREFFLIELEDGTILREFSDGSIEPPTVATTSVLINDAIRHGVFVEVRS